MEEFESYEGQFRDGDRVYVDKPLRDIIEAENCAVVSIVLGSLSIAFSSLCFGFILGIFAVINEKKAKRVLNARHHKYHVATAGMICGWVSIPLSIIFIIYYILIIVAAVMHTY